MQYTVIGHDGDYKVVPVYANGQLVGRPVFTTRHRRVADLRAELYTSGALIP